MRSWLALTSAMFLLLGFSGCKGTSDHLDDLTPGEGIQNSGRLGLGRYDSGQLVHEAFAGLIEAEELTTQDIARSVSSAGYIVANNEVPLLRANALAYLAHVTRRFPLPPLSDAALDPGQQETIDLLNAITDAQAPLEPGNAVIAAGSPDRAVALRAIRLLEKTTGLGFGDDAEAWAAWWDEGVAGFRTEADAAAAAPMESLGRMRTPGRGPRQRLITASGLLRIIANGDFYRESLRERRRAAVVNLARQVAIEAIVVSLEARPIPEDRDDFDIFPRLTSDLDIQQAAESARLIQDPAFEAPLLGAYRWASEVQAGSNVMLGLIGALRVYPSGTLIEVSIRNLDPRFMPDPTVRLAAHELLVSVTGSDQGPDASSWRDWWSRTGSARWKQGT